MNIFENLNSLLTEVGIRHCLLINTNASCSLQCNMQGKGAPHVIFVKVKKEYLIYWHEKKLT